MLIQHTNRTIVYNAARRLAKDPANHLYYVEQGETVIVFKRHEDSLQAYQLTYDGEVHPTKFFSELTLRSDFTQTLQELIERTKKVAAENNWRVLEPSEYFESGSIN